MLGQPAQSSARLVSAPSASSTRLELGDVEEVSKPDSLSHARLAFYIWCFEPICDPHNLSLMTMLTYSGNYKAASVRLRCPLRPRGER